MKLYFHHYKISVKTGLKICGYSFRPGKKDFIREEHNTGRFHAIQIAPKVIEIHYDLYVGWKHVSFPMPYKFHQERQRIVRLMRRFETKQITAEMLDKLNKKYD